MSDGHQVELHDKRIMIDGRPQLIISGEIHYFRLDRAVWQDRIDKLKAAGGNAVAAYIPWLCHELAEGEFDFDGRTLPQLDLGGFIDLCRENDLWFFARPGPFVMAELKNEGLPYRLYDQHPELVPVTWDGKTVPTRTVDYLAPAFLEESRRWYAAVAEVLRPRLRPNGGNIIAIQLDNEIGMLSWLTRSPDLTDGILADLWSWLERRHGDAGRTQRYPPDRFSPAVRKAGFRSPPETSALPLLRDLGHYMRDRFARYAAALRAYAEEAGLGGVPFVINVHGTDNGRGVTFPIGISQLYEAYTQAEGYLAGTDIYLGDLTAANLSDLYLLNGFMEATHRPEQPLTSVEFECGDGDYGSDGSVRHDPSAADFKLRVCVAQGARLVNLYLFAGGINYRLPEPIGDGNNRISFTGERHGIAAPVGPEGQLNVTYPRLARVIRGLMAVGDKLAETREEHDHVALGFIPDYFMTESIHPNSGAMRDFVDNLTSNRFGGPRGGVPARAMLLAGYRFGCLDIQHRDLDPATTPLLVLASARFMDHAIQTTLVNFLERGGHLLLVGEVPRCDMDGAACTTLANRLGLHPIGERHASAFYHLSVTSDGWAAPRPELRIGWAQVFASSTPDVLFRVYGADEACGFEIAVGMGRAIVVTADLPCDVDFFRTALERLGATAALAHNNPDLGIFLTSSITPRGERFLHLLNLDGYDKPVRLTDAGRDLLPGPDLILRRKDGLLLPFNVAAGPAHIIRSTAELAAVDSDALTFRLTQPADVVTLETTRSIVPSDTYAIAQQDRQWLVTSRRPVTDGIGEDMMTVRFA